MSDKDYAYAEQDSSHPPSGNELPTYDDLANQNGPNSRYLNKERALHGDCAKGFMSLGLAAGEGG